MEISNNSIIEFRLSIQQKDDDSYIIGNLNENNYLEVPLEAIQIIKYCDGKRTLGNVSELVNQECGYEVDVNSFIQALFEEDLVYSIDSIVYGKNNNVSYGRFLKTIASILFNFKMHKFYAFILLIDFVLMFIFKGNRPVYDNISIFQNKPGLSVLIFFVISWSITLLHESGHYLSAVELNIPVKLRLNLRMVFLVVESDINGVWSVERKRRYMCYMAGIYIESLILLFALIFKFIANNIFFINILDAIILIIFLNYIWQFMIFMRTDIYFVLFNYLNITELHNASIRYLKNIIKNRKISYTKNKASIVYSIIYCIGLLFSVIYAVYTLAMYGTLILEAYNSFDVNSMNNNIDKVILLFMLSVNIVIWAIGLKNWYLNRTTVYQKEVI